MNVYGEASTYYLNAFLLAFKHVTPMFKKMEGDAFLFCFFPLPNRFPLSGDNLGTSPLSTFPWVAKYPCRISGESWKPSCSSPFVGNVVWKACVVEECVEFLKSCHELNYHIVEV